MDRQGNGWEDGWINVVMDECRDNWMGKWMGKGMDGWIDRKGERETEVNRHRQKQRWERGTETGNEAGTDQGTHLRMSDPWAIASAPGWPPLRLFSPCLPGQRCYKGLGWPVLIGRLPEHQCPSPGPLTTSPVPRNCLGNGPLGGVFLVISPCLWNFLEITFQTDLLFLIHLQDDANLTTSAKARPL